MFVEFLWTNVSCLLPLLVMLMPTKAMAFFAPTSFQKNSNVLSKSLKSTETKKLISFRTSVLDEGAGLRHRLPAIIGVAFYSRIQDVACLFNFRFFNTCSNWTSRSQ